jgi:hypothetical protein
VLAHRSPQLQEQQAGRSNIALGEQEGAFHGFQDFTMDIKSKANRKGAERKGDTTVAAHYEFFTNSFFGSTGV